ncbi:unnamed protein product [Lathyrus oleraceus]
MSFCLCFVRLWRARAQSSNFSSHSPLFWVYGNHSFRDRNFFKKSLQEIGERRKSLQEILERRKSLQCSVAILFIKEINFQVFCWCSDETKLTRLAFGPSYQALAINKSRMTHEKSISRNRSTTSRTHQRTQTPPIQTTKAAAPPQTTKAASPSQTIEAAPSNFKQCTFVPTTGVTQHVLPGPALHHTTMVEEAGDQTVSDEEEEVEQAFFDRQREMIKIVDYGLLFGGSRVMTPK